MILAILSFASEQVEMVAQAVDGRPNTFRWFVLDLLDLKPYLKFSVKDPKILIHVVFITSTINKYVFILEDSRSMTLALL